MKVELVRTYNVHCMISMVDCKKWPAGFRSYTVAYCQKPCSNRTVEYTAASHCLGEEQGKRDYGRIRTNIAYHFMQLASEAA